MYTKGEWRVDRKRSSFEYDIYSKDNPPKVIARVPSGVSNYSRLVPAEGEANAQLIASAPDLYEACKEGLELLSINLEANRGKVSELLKQALAKAEGK